jgi:S1-C subfamily serine protease
MTDHNLTTLSEQMADAVAAAAPSVVQVHGRRQPASGVVYADDSVLTTTRALGREDHLRVRRHDGAEFEAELTGWDPTTGLALLRVAGLGVTPATQATSAVRVGHLAIAIARSWSNALTASAGIVSVIGGPLPTGRRRAIDQVIRTTAPMHDGFSGGAFVDTTGRVIGITTASAIRGLGVVIPAAIAWKSAASVLQHGRLKRGYLGLASQTVRLADRQREAAQREHGLLVVSVSTPSPAASGGMLVGDVMLDFDGRPIESPEDLLDLLLGDRTGRQVPVRVLRGAEAIALSVTVGERTV